MANEVILLKKCLKGDSKAFEVIVSKYQELICAITYSGIADVQRSEELAHQTFINAWNKLSHLKDLSKFRPWLCSIARNNIRDFLKKSQRDIIAKAKPMENVNDISTDEPGPLESAIKKEHEAFVSNAIQQVPEQYREPLVLYYRQQQSVKQVAISLDLSEDVVKQRLQRGRKMIKEQLSSLVEETLSSSGPKKAFTTAVIASVTGMAIRGAGASAATITAVTSTAGGATGMVAVMSGAVTKIVIAAVVITIGIASVVTYNQITKPSHQPQLPQTAIVATEQENESQVVNIENEVESVEEKGVGETVVGKKSENEIAMIADPCQEDVVATKYEFKAQGVLSGLITDAETGEPVTDAELEISVRRIYNTKTDKNGFYSFDSVEPEGNYRIKLTSKEYVGVYDYNKMPVINLAKGKQSVKHFQLEKACMIEVLVVDEAGEPIKGVQLLATSLADDRKRDIGGSTYTQKTDDEGYLLMGGFLPAETSYLITATHKVEDTRTKNKDGIIHVTMKSAHAPDKLIVKLNDPDVIEYGEIILKKGVEVKGYAEYSDGVPAGDLSISAYPQWWHSNHCPARSPIDPNGYFTIPHIASGMYRMQIVIPLGEGGATGYNVSQSQLPLKDGELLVVKIPQKSPQSLASISGKIKYIGDKRPNSVHVYATSKQGGRGSTNIGRNQGGLLDTFTIDRLEPGRYNLTFSGTEIERKVIKNIEVPANGLEVELKYIMKPKLKGIVVDLKSQEPINRFRARARKLKTLRGSNYVQSGRWSEFTNTEGKFDIDLVGPGVYQIQIAADGYAWQWSSDVSTDKNDPVNIQLSVGGSIIGRVVNESGGPVDGAKVIPLSRSGGAMPRTMKLFTSEEGAVKTVKGEFVLKNIAYGMETLKFVHADYGFTVVKDIEVVEGQITDEIEIILGKGATVEGYVYDVSGSPQSNVVLYFQDDSGYSGSGDEQAGRLAMVITDPNGFYRASGLPEQMCYVRRQNGWSSLGVVSQAIVPVKGKVSRLDFGGKPIVSGKVVINGKPLADSKVELTATDNPNFGTFKCFFITGKEGEFEFAGVPRGIYSIYYENPQKRSDWIKIATIEVDGSDLDVGVVPEDSTEIRLTIEKEDKDSEWEVDNIYLQEGAKIWSQKVGKVKEPAKEGEPYIINMITPGRYYIVATRSDNMMIRQEIKVKEEKLDITLTIPKATASISGVFVVESQIPSMMIWSKDKKVVGYIHKGEDGTFRLDGLPAGEYSVGGNMMIESGAILELELADGQHKDIEIDTSNYSPQEIATLSCIVLDENGVPITNAKTRLEDDFGEVIEPMTITSRGQYFITKPGKYMLYASCSGFKNVTREVELTALNLHTVQGRPLPLLIRLESKR